MSKPKITVKSIPFIFPPAVSSFTLQPLARHATRADLLKYKWPWCATAWKGLLRGAYRMRSTVLALAQKSSSNNLQLPPQLHLGLPPGPPQVLSFT